MSAQRPRLNHDTAALGLMDLITKLSLDTCYDEEAYLQWASANAMTLDFEFALTGLELDAYGGWAREQFVNRSNAVAA
jgi:hypothetical protein